VSIPEAGFLMLNDKCLIMVSALLTDSNALPKKRVILSKRQRVEESTHCSFCNADYQCEDPSTAACWLLLRMTGFR